jgi:hypothetical protein
VESEKTAWETEENVSDELSGIIGDELQEFVGAHPELGPVGWVQHLVPFAIQNAHRGGVPREYVEDIILMTARSIYGVQDPEPIPADKLAELAAATDLNLAQGGLRKALTQLAGALGAAIPLTHSWALFIFAKESTGEVGFVSNEDRDNAARWITHWVNSQTGSWFRPAVLEMLDAIMSKLTPEQVANVTDHQATGQTVGEDLGVKTLGDRAARHMRDAAEHLYRFKLVVDRILNEPAGPGASPEAVG